jgi:hypothetical protein
MNTIANHDMAKCGIGIAKKRMIAVSLFVVLLAATLGVSRASAQSSDDSDWTDWAHDQNVLSDLSVRSRCVQDPDNAKKSRWELEFFDGGSSPLQVKGKGWSFEVPAGEQIGTGIVPVKNCSKALELKLDAGASARHYDYKAEYKAGVLKVHRRVHTDWMGLIAAGMEGAAAGLNGTPLPTPAPPASTDDSAGDDSN